MPLLYKLHKLVRTFKDGRTDKANNHWFARAIHTGVVDTDQLADQISYSTTVTPADCRAVLKALGKVMKDNLQNSQVVKLDSIGSFKLGLKSTGSESAAEFNVGKNIKGVHMNFYPEYTIDTASNTRIIAMLQGTKVQETALNLVTKD